MKPSHLTVVAMAAVVSIGIAARAPAADLVEQSTPIDDASLNDVRAGAGFSNLESWGSVPQLLLPASEGFGQAKTSLHGAIDTGIAETRIAVSRALGQLRIARGLR